MDPFSGKIAIVATAFACSLIFATTASATTLQVDTAGTDSPTCGPVTPCLTIQQAVTNSVTNDTIQISAGTFTVKNITVNNKNLTINGAGVGATIIDGADATDAPGQGAFRFNGNGTTSTISNMSFQRLARTNALTTTPARAILVQPSAAGNSTNVSISNVEVFGSAPSVTPAVTALGSSANTGTLSVDNVHTFSMNGQSLLLERHRGPVTVQNSNFEQANNGYAIYDTSYGGSAWNVTGAHTFTNNTFNGPAGIFVNAGFAYSNLAESSYLGQVTIANNTFQSGVGSLVGIRLENTPIGSAPSTATMSLVSIANNSILGNDATGLGVALNGNVAGTTITNNNIRNFADGIDLADSSKSPADAPSGTQINRNQLVDNGFDAKTGLRAASAVSGVNATDNWWGCNAGPPVGPAEEVSPCDSAELEDSNSAVVEPHMLLTIAADKSTLAASESSAVSGALTQNSAGATLTNVIPDGTNFLFDGNGGTVSAPSAPTTSGATGVTFTSTGQSGRSANVTYDHETVSYTWLDLDAAPPVVTITAPTNGSVVDSVQVELRYAVSEAATCSPPSGSAVNLGVGASTIVVTCTDAAGNVGTASTTVFRPDPLPQCAHDIVITDVERSGSQTRIKGLARLKYAGQRITVQYRPTGKKTVARPVVQPNGTWQATVHRPSKPPYTSNNARYRAVLSKTATSWVKLTRRMGATTVISVGDDKLRISGGVSLPIAKGQPLRVMRSDACGTYRQVSSLNVSNNGKFSGTVSDGGNSEVAVFIRLKLKVRSSSGKTFNTYSIVQPAILKR